MGVPHPIPYQGSKRALARFIVSVFPEGGERLVEPFAGSAAVSLAAAYYNKARSFVLNDANVALMNLWDEIINRPQEISAAYEELWRAQEGRERQFYDIIRSKFNETHLPPYLLYLLARCVKASVRYNALGQFNQSPDNRRKGANPATMRFHVYGASNLLRARTTLYSVDYKDVLARLKADDLVYMDPSYQGVCDNGDPRYIRAVAFEEFVLALRDLVNRGISFILSYDGRTGPRTYGRPLPSDLGLHHIEVNAGRSSQATLLGRNRTTYESLYLSKALVERSQMPVTRLTFPVSRQLALL